MLGNTLRIEHQAEIDPERKTPQEPTTDQSMVYVSVCENVRSYFSIQLKRPIPRVLGGNRSNQSLIVPVRIGGLMLKQAFAQFCFCPVLSKTDIQNVLPKYFESDDENVS